MHMGPNIIALQYRFINVFSSWKVSWSSVYSVDCFVNKWERNFWFHLETPASTGTDNETGFKVFARGQTIQWPTKTKAQTIIYNTLNRNLNIELHEPYLQKCWIDVHALSLMY